MPDPWSLTFDVEVQRRGGAGSELVGGVAGVGAAALACDALHHQGHVAGKHTASVRQLLVLKIERR